jgi:hypothetical protein
VQPRCNADATYNDTTRRCMQAASVQCETEPRAPCPPMGFASHDVGIATIAVAQELLASDLPLGRNPPRRPAVPCVSTQSTLCESFTAGRGSPVRVLRVPCVNPPRRPAVPCVSTQSTLCVNPPRRPAVALLCATLLCLSVHPLGSRGAVL